MKRILFLSLCLFLVVPAMAKDFKIVSQEFLPLAGSGADGKMTGVYYEIVKQACAKAKLTCKYELMPLARGLDQIKTGEAHMILGVAPNPERLEIAHFPKLFTQVGYTFFLKKGEAKKYTKIEDFKGMTVAAHGGSATHKNLIEQNKKIGDTMKIVEEPTAETAPRKLAGGRYEGAAALYCARAVCMDQAKREKLDIEPVAFDGFMQSHSIGISKAGVTAEETEAITKAFAEVMKAAATKKLITSNNLAIHPDFK